MPVVVGNVADAVATICARDRSRARDPTHTVCTSRLDTLQSLPSLFANTTALSFLNSNNAASHSPRQFFGVPSPTMEDLHGANRVPPALSRVPKSAKDAHVPSPEGPVSSTLCFLRQALGPDAQVLDRIQRLQRSVLSSVLSIVYRHVTDRSIVDKAGDTVVD